MPSIGTRRVGYDGPADAPLYAVGEAPGFDEETEGVPFIGKSGELLRNCLARAGAGPVRFLNLCQYRPAENKFPILLNSRQLREGVEELRQEIIVNRPNCILALGNWPLYYLTGMHGTKGPGSGIGKFRGSILPCVFDEEIKVVGSFHPAAILRNRGDYPIFDTDIKRAVGDSKFREFNYPECKIITPAPGEELDHYTELLCNADRLGCDIEGVKRTTRILCHGFSPSPDLSVVIPHSDTNLAYREALHRIYESDAKKIFHNGFGYDIIMLKLNGFEVKNYWWDTMVAQHIMWAELPKSLEYLTSVYSRRPYYKTSGRATIPDDEKGWDEKKFNRAQLHEYNGTDTSETIFIQLQQEKEMNEGPVNWKKLFDFEMRETETSVAISLEGMPIDQQRRDVLRRALETKWAINQFVLDRLTGYRTNVNSPKAIAKILYDADKMRLPPRKNRDGSLTTDEDAIVSLIAFCKDKLGKMKPGGNAIKYWQIRFDVLQTILLIRGIRKLLSSYINVQMSEDGKFRGVYKVAGPETGRWACSGFVDKTGGNAQTWPREVIEVKNFAAIPELEEVLKFIFQEEEADNDASREASDEEHGSRAT